MSKDFTKTDKFDILPDIGKVRVDVIRKHIENMYECDNVFINVDKVSNGKMDLTIKVVGLEIE